MTKNTNIKPKYAIIDEETGKVLEKFRIKLTANSMLYYYKTKYSPLKLKIIEI
jgi:hypothetical protein